MNKTIGNSNISHNTDNTETNIIELRNITKSYKEGNKKIVVLNNINFSLKNNEKIAICGYSGSGKSTLINIINKIENSDCGELNGRYNSTIVHQKARLIEELTVEQNILFFLRDMKQKMDKYKFLMEATGIQKLVKRMPNQISGGEKQRVTIVRALINEDINLLLLDEPTAALDKKNGEDIIELVFNLQQQLKFALICVTHNLEVANKMDKIYYLKNGELSYRAK